MVFKVGIGVLVGCGALLVAQCALADTILVSGSNCRTDCITYNDVGSTPAAPINTIELGSLSNPVNVAFSDNLGSNSSGGPILTTDNYTFMVPSTSASATISGDQVWLNNVGFSGTVDSFSLIDLSTGTTVAQETPLSPFTGLLLDPSLAAGLYELQVKATLNAGATGSYDGVLVANASPVPLPATAWMMLCGLGAVAVLTRQRKLS
jgi:hypothetical protein